MVMKSENNSNKKQMKTEITDFTAPIERKDHKEEKRVRKRASKQENKREEGCA